ncbi:type I restriction-modification system, S subunit [Mycoplasmopsis meleagridis]|uniref:Type I restriction-modification system, specificity subunit S n=1 Tax=Mycoplasmopsis meleagridis ATCC 25294 TaxID=1264554 RepID=A0A0F5H0U4_9BACT|nr:restriction endonuclease subunit S [Mycoplasmopsis meleagridis]KKB26904.1 Type I restriction-modification system, specificity subunit S [Mycoplasmopsis meleagridis ATCC 25294]VEU77560.1 type I restriction-modification system, S subunit [Mycoplasmopsis meleagridis]
MQYIFGAITLELGTFSNLYHGFNFKSKHLLNDKLEIGSIIKIKNIYNDGSINFSLSNKFNLKNYKTNLEKFRVNKNNILISASGSLGKIGFSSGEEKNCFINLGIVKIEVLENLAMPEFIYFYLTSMINDWLKIKELKSALSYINTEDISKIKLLIPPLSFQNKIVNYLNSFKKICSDFNIVLPTEENKRKKQYEYYKNAIFKYLEVCILKYVDTQRDR